MYFTEFAPKHTVPYQYGKHPLTFFRKIGWYIFPSWADMILRMDVWLLLTNCNLQRSTLQRLFTSFSTQSQIPHCFKKLNSGLRNAANLLIPTVIGCLEERNRISSTGLSCLCNVQRYNNDITSSNFQWTQHTAFCIQVAVCYQWIITMGRKQSLCHLSLCQCWEASTLKKKQTKNTAGIGLQSCLQVTVGLPGCRPYPSWVGTVPGLLTWHYLLCCHALVCKLELHPCML